MLYINTEVSSGKLYIMMEARIEALFKKPEEFEILERWVAYQWDLPFDVDSPTYRFVGVNSRLTEYWLIHMALLVLQCS